MAEIPKQLLGNLKGPQGDPGPNIVSSETGTSGFENGHVLFNNNGNVGGKKLTASDVGARPDSWTPSAEDVGAQPKIEFQTLSPTKGPTVNRNYCTVRRYGQVCFVTVSLSLNSIPEAYSRDTVLLSGLPPADVAGGGVVYCQQDGLAHYMQVGTDGVLKLYVSAKKPTVSDPYFWGGFSYPIADGS